jgi:hypothetical protein
MKDNRRLAEIVCAVMEMGVDLADSDTAVTDFLSDNRRAINEIRLTHQDLGDRLKTHTTRRREALKMLERSKMTNALAASPGPTKTTFREQLT